MKCRPYLKGILGNLKENLNITVYRLLQAGLAFAGTHMHAGHIIAELNRQNNKARAAISPNSSDYDLGLLGMREQTLSAGGVFSIDHGQENEILIKAQLFINYDKSGPNNNA